MNKPHYNPALSCKRRTGCGTIHATLVYDIETYQPIAFQFILGKAGGCACSQLNGLQTVINYIVKHGLPLDPLYNKDDQHAPHPYSLRGIRCPEVMADDEDWADVPEEKLNLSCSDVIAKSMKYLLAKLAESKPTKK